MNSLTKTTALDLIDRELAKRATTYPKIIARKKKAAVKAALAQGAPADQVDEFADGEVFAETRIQSLYMEDLNLARWMISDGRTSPRASQAAGMALAELRRELAMRKKCYPRFIYLKRITPEVAQRELADWGALVEFFTETFITAPMKGAKF